MRRTSDTSIAISCDIKKSVNSQIQSKHNPRLKEYTTNLTKFKKDNLSIVEENYEPSLGISFLDRKESEKIKNKTELQDAFYNFGQASSRVVVSPLDEIAVLKNKNYVKNGLNLIRLVSKFIRQLKIHSQTFQYKMINENILQLLGDQASNTQLFIVYLTQLYLLFINSRNYLLVIQLNTTKYYENHQNLYKYNVFIQEISIFIKIKGKSQIPIFYKLKIYQIRYLFSIQIIQYQLGLRLYYFYYSQSILLIFLFYCFLMNMILIRVIYIIYQIRFQQCFVCQIVVQDSSHHFMMKVFNDNILGILYKDIGKIAKHYLKNDFIVDIVSIIPIFTDSLVLQYLTIFRIIKLKLTLATLEEILCFKQQIQGWWELIKSVFFIVYTCHFFACIWYKIGEQGVTERLLIYFTLKKFEQVNVKNNTNSWLIVKELNNSSWQEQYFFSLYFIVITTLTIGYGDILPCTVTEALFTIFIAFTGCSVLGYTINNIGEIFKNLNERDVKFKQQMKSILQYLKDYNINKNLSLQIRKYFEYHLKSQIENNNEGQQMIHQLSRQLREQMQIDLYKKYLMRAKFIQDYCSQSTIEKLCQYIKIESYAPESKILNQKANCEKLYYVLEGELDIYITLGNSRDVSICNSLKKDDIIGQWEFVLQNPYLYSVKAIKFTKLLFKQNRIIYTKVLRENKEDFEKFNQIKDKLSFSKKSRGNKCFVCGWIHYFNKCPFLFFIADKEKVLSQALNIKEQNRNAIKRLRKLEKSRTFLRLNNLRQAALDFIQDSETSDLNLQHLVDLGFNKNDSILHGSAIYFDELIEKKKQSTFQVIENEDDSNHSYFPKVVSTYKNRSIVFAPTSENDSFLNLKFQSPEQFNRQNSNTIQRPRKQTKELSRIKQSQPKIFFSTKKIDSKMNFMKRNDVSSNFQSQMSSNLNNILTTNNNIYLNQNDNFESQQGSSSQHRSEQPSSVNPLQVNQIQNCPVEINFDIDKTQVFSNYFKEGNIYEIVNQLMEYQQKQIILKSPRMIQKSIMLGSNKNHRKLALLQKILKKDSLII